MYPMSLYESRESNGEISLQTLFDSDINGITSSLSFENLVFAACRGGWPASQSARSDKAKPFIAKDYLNVICAEDISRVDNVKRNPTLARLILLSYTRNLCTLTQKTKMLVYVTVEMKRTSMTAFEDYVGALEKLFVIEGIEAWCIAILGNGDKKLQKAQFCRSLDCCGRNGRIAKKSGT